MGNVLLFFFFFFQKKFSLYLGKWILFIQQWKCALIRSWVLFFATAGRLCRVWQALIFKWYPQTWSWLQLNHFLGWGLGGGMKSTGKMEGARKETGEEGKKGAGGKEGWRCSGAIFGRYVGAPVCCVKSFCSPAPSWDCSHEGRAGCWWSGIKADEVRLYGFYQSGGVVCDVKLTAGSGKCIGNGVWQGFKDLI